MKPYRLWSLFALAALCAAALQADASPKLFVLGATGVSLKKNVVYVALTIWNTSGQNAVGVQVNSIRIGTAHVLVPDTPVPVGNIPARTFSVARATLARDSLQPAKTYPAMVAGRATFGTSVQPFQVTGTIQFPPAPGSAKAREAVLPPQLTRGGYPARKPSFSIEADGPRWVVPNGPLRPAKPTGQQTTSQQGHLGDPAGVTFKVDASNGINGSTVAEPSGANGGGVVFMTSNWYAAYSTNAGTSFRQLNPTTVFPADPVGFCCDQIVVYVKSIDRFIWLLQGNGMRLASASPASIKKNKGKIWNFWKITPSSIGEPAGAGFDYPDLAVGDNDLYMSWDTCWPGNPPGCNQGREIVRASLSKIKAGGYLPISWTNPSDSSNAWGSHLSQDTGNMIAWAGQDDNSDIRIFYWPESSSSYTWTDIGISTWANNTLTSFTPDRVNWMKKLNGFPGNAVIGATRNGNEYWFAWSAGTDSNYPQPHVEMVELDANNGFNPVQQVQIWNSGFAYGYPALATNACTREIGFSVEEGGGGAYENFDVGFWGDFLTHTMTSSNKGVNRFGDYVSIRQDLTTKGGNRFFDAFGYGVQKGLKTDTRYVQFGRSKC